MSHRISMVKLIFLLLQFSSPFELQSFHLERLQVSFPSSYIPVHLLMQYSVNILCIFQPLRDCLSLSMSHNQVHHDYCFASANDQSINPRNDLNKVEAEQRSRRVKRISGPIIRRSLLEFEKSGKQMCSIPCQKQPLLVDKKKILDFIGLKWLANQIPERF